MIIRPEIGELDNAKLAGLIFELASQLHAERARRFAIEAALASSGILRPDAIEVASQTPAFREAADAAADASIRKLLRVLSESPDERTPLRSEAIPAENGEN